MERKLFTKSFFYCRRSVLPTTFKFQTLRLMKELWFIQLINIKFSINIPKSGPVNSIVKINSPAVLCIESTQLFTNKCTVCSNRLWCCKVWRELQSDVNVLDNSPHKPKLASRAADQWPRDAGLNTTLNIYWTWTWTATAAVVAGVQWLEPGGINVVCTVCSNLTVCYLIYFCFC